MANYSYKSAKGNPFDEDDDVDDYEFLHHPKQGHSGYMLGNTADNSYDHSSGNNSRQMQIEDEVRRIAERTSDRSDRCLGLIYDSEKIGIATAEELLHQREQLQNSERKIDEVNASLKTTQKHITSIKSIFGGIKSYFSKSPEQRQRLLDECPQKSSDTASALEEVVEKVKSEVKFEQQAASIHPGLRIRGLDDSPDDTDTLLQATSSSNSYRGRYADINKRIDSNLDEMSFGLDRLKGLARGLGDEIDEHNVIIERVTDKVDTGDLKMTQQNNQLRRILGR